jgi:lysozyme
VKISDAGIAHLKKFEGCRYETYLDIGGVPTIGFGHTGPDVQMGMCINEEEAERLLRLDLASAEKCVTDLVEVWVSQCQFDALVSFAYNIGCGALKHSTLLKKLNGGDHEGAALEFPRWNKVRGRVVNGLTRRREAERDLFLS